MKTVSAPQARTSRGAAEGDAGPHVGGVSRSIGIKLAKRAEEDYRVGMLLGFTLGPAEIAVIVLIVLLIFGPSKLPQLGSSVGKMLRGFKKEMKSINDDEPAEGNDEALTGSKSNEIDVTPTANAEKKSASSS